jgi:hypothetical protein
MANTTFKEITVYGRFAPAIEVVLWYINHNYLLSSIYQIQVVYTWKEFLDKYEASKVGL